MRFMLSIDSLSNVTDQRKVRLQTELRQGQKHDFFGTITVLSAQDPPLVRVQLSGKSGQDRPSARAMDPEKDFYVRLGIGGRAATVRLRLHKVESDDQVLLLPVEIVQEEQNRAFFRVQTSFDVGITPAGSGKDSPVPGRALDISGGGLLLRTPEYFKPGIRLNLQFSLDVDGAEVLVECTGTVIRCLAAGEKGYDTAVEFTDLVEEQRDVIMAYCFARQREQLREKVQVRDL